MMLNRANNFRACHSTSRAGSLAPFGVGLALLGLTLVVLVALAVVGLQTGPRHALPVLGTIQDFVLTNQHGQRITLTELRGRVWAADIIFTRCAGPCPEMTRRMKALQDALPSRSRILLVTLTTDPLHDSPEVLRRYGERFGANFQHWWFLTGAPDQIARLAVDGLKLTALEIPESQRTNPADLFIHSTTFVVVDAQGRLRASFEAVGEDVSFEPVKRRILGVLRRLEREATNSPS
ncbi:MAG: SCO family protein [Verrucomicrobiota bacterium]|nr:SCO family protein [Limisphaera sp.]MDW8382174.1 SCO family protein [Verrucomicrobiota bacterium]